jgi:hypothetical protein
MIPLHDSLAAQAGGRLVVYVEGKESAEIVFKNLYIGISSRIEFKGLGSCVGFGPMAAEIQTISPGLRCFFLSDRDYKRDEDCKTREKLVHLPCHELENLLLDPQAIASLAGISEEDVKAELCRQAERYRFWAATEALLQLEIEKPTRWPELGKNPDRFGPDPIFWAEWVSKNVEVEESVVKIKEADIFLLAKKINGYVDSFSPFTWPGPWKTRMPGKEILSAAKQSWTKVRSLPDDEFGERIAEAIASSRDSQGFPDSETLVQMNSLIRSLLKA